MIHKMEKGFLKAVMFSSILNTSHNHHITHLAADSSDRQSDSLMENHWLITSDYRNMSAGSSLQVRCNVRPDVSRTKTIKQKEWWSRRSKRSKRKQRKRKKKRVDSTSRDVLPERTSLVMLMRCFGLIHISDRTDSKYRNTDQLTGTGPSSM